MIISTLNNDLDMMQLEVFFQVLDIIEGNNHTWFASRPGSERHQEHDALANHFIVVQEQDQVRFTFKPDSELPDRIRHQCNKAYAALFPEDIWK